MAVGGSWERMRRCRAGLEVVRIVFVGNHSLVGLLVRSVGHLIPRLGMGLIGGLVLQLCMKRHLGNKQVGHLVLMLNGRDQVDQLRHERQSHSN